MLRFCRATDGELASLKRRAAGRCLEFQDRLLPQHAVPDRARIGIQVAIDETTTLFVDKGIRYSGHQPSVREWFAEGQLQFRDFSALCRWWREELAAAYDGPPRVCEFDLAGVSCGWTGPSSTVPLFGRDDVLEEIDATLDRRIEPTAALLVGKHGVGATKVCQTAVRRWESRGPANVAVRADLPVLLADAQEPAERTRRLAKLYQRILQMGEGTLLVMERIDVAVGSASAKQPWSPNRGGRTGDPHSSWLLRSAIDEGLRLLATVTPGALRTLNERALRRRLRVIPLNEPPTDVLLAEILPAVGELLAANCRLDVPRESLITALSQSEKLVGAQPAKVIRLLERAATRAARRRLHVLGPDDLLE